MRKSKKPTHKMTDRELMHAIFPKEVVEHVTKVARAARKKANK